MKVWGGLLLGIRLTDINGKNHVDIIWSTTFKESGDWVTYSIPFGQAIIGLQCNTHYQFISRLGFILWDQHPELIY